MDLTKFLAVSTILFLLGLWGIFLNRKNIIVMLMSLYTKCRDKKRANKRNKKKK